MVTIPCELGEAYSALADLTPALLVLADRANEVAACACHRPVISEDAHEANRCAYCHGLLWNPQEPIRRASDLLEVIARWQTV